jgi:hypothetical protein
MALTSDQIETLRESIRAALVHQARQPLFALQNYLSVTTQLAKRLDSTPDVQLMQNCFVEMRSSIQQLSHALTCLDDFGAKGTSNLNDTNLLTLIEVSFQIANSITRRLKMRVQWTIQPEIVGTLYMDASRVQLSLLQWILDNCEDVSQNSVGEKTVVITAEPIEGDVIIRCCLDTDDRIIRLSNLIFSSENDPSTLVSNS